MTYGSKLSKEIIINFYGLENGSVEYGNKIFLIITAYNEEGSVGKAVEKEIYLPRPSRESP